MPLIRNLKIRWKLLAVVLPLVVLPILIVGGIVGYVSKQQAYRGITQTSEADLEHMSQFAIDLLNAHYQQFQVYQEDKRQMVNKDLATLVEFAYNLIAVQHEQHLAGKLDLDTAKQEARQALKSVNVGETGYLYAMSTKGDLYVHVAQEGENIYDAQDENGRYFIREMCVQALKAEPGDVLYIIYPWRNEILGDLYAREKVVAYKYFQPWDWIVAAGSYLEETYENTAFEKQAFAELKDKLLNKKVGETGYIYAMTTAGTLTIHPFREGENIADEQDENGRYFIREMAERKRGWIRYLWQDETNPHAGEHVYDDYFARLDFAHTPASYRTKIVRYDYFEPWDWIVAVGSYEDEFYQQANEIQGRILSNMVMLVLVVGLFSVGLVFYASKVLTEPIRNMIAGIREVKRGRLDTRLPVTSSDELGELAEDFNLMTAALRKNKELEASLAQQGKMASLGVLSSGVAHEINNPLGVILGYAAYLENKLDPADPNYKFIQEIKRESKRCKNIVQDLLSYARVPKPALEETDINELLDQIVDFAANHIDMHHVKVAKQFADGLPRIRVDPDQIRQVAMNLMLNAGAAVADGGRLTVSTALGEDGFVQLAFQDNGAGIPPENLEKIFEPFFTTKTQGTGLGLAITRMIIEKHQGTIRIDSEPGQGTTVTVSLPTRREGC